MRQLSFYWSVFVWCVCGMTVEIPAVGSDLPPVSSSVSRSKSESAEVREFEVRVDDRPVGTHRLTIKSVGDTQQAEFQTDVKIDVIVYAYIFKLRGTEVWREGRVESANVSREQGGKKRSFSLETDGCDQKITLDGKPVSSSSPSLMTTTYWRLPPPEIRDNSLTIVDSDNGRSQTATLEFVSNETISTSGRSMACRHFKIDGPSPAELWFDEHERLVCQKALERGHQVELRLKQIRSPKDDH